VAGEVDLTERALALFLYATWLLALFAVIDQARRLGW
jgi:hypothetical protein